MSNLERYGRSSDLFDLTGFFDRFPTYLKYKTPMWSEWEEEDDKTVLSIAVPGYEKEDFVLGINKQGDLSLEIKKDKGQKVLYSILSWDSLHDYEYEKAEATYRRGILKITIPKLKEKKNLVEIPIKVS